MMGENEIAEFHFLLAKLELPCVLEGGSIVVYTPKATYLTIDG
jgi:hypothetical protein